MANPPIGKNGPYVVSMELYDGDGTRLDQDEHATAAYLYTQFEPPPAKFLPPHQDQGLDEDANGLYDYLMVKARIEVSVPDWYMVRGTLYGDQYDYITSASQWVRLEAGIQSVELRFRGWEIRESGRNGPYRVKLQLRRGWWELIDEDEYFTQVYSYVEFEPRPAQFFPPHLDRALDLEDDGLYDYLVVEAKVFVAKEGDYIIRGELRGQDWTYIDLAHVEQHLGVGVHSIELRFFGPSIERSGVDGPYRVRLWLYDQDWNWVDSDLHITQPYSYTQFQPWPARFARPHQAYGLDVDGDGFYNYLVIKPGVEVKKAGRYRLRAWLWWLNQTFEVEQELGVGIGSIELWVEGRAISGSERDGPYWMSLRLYDNDGNWLDGDWLSTPRYTYGQFRSSSVWEIETIERGAGWHASFELDENDQAHLSYYDPAKGDLKYARRTPKGWEVEVIDNAGDVGGWTSLELDSTGRPHISYYDFTNRCLKYARRTGSSWAIEVVDDAWEVGKFSSLALDSQDRPHIAYWDERNRHLKYAWWDGSRWRIERVDAIGEVGMFCSLALDSNNNPHIAYYGDWYLKYARRVEGRWVKHRVARADVSTQTSIALDRWGRPHIAYFDQRHADLCYARLTEEGWEVETVDSAGSVGWQPAIAVDRYGRARICYYGLGENSAKLATWTGAEWVVERIAPAYVSYSSRISLSFSRGFTRVAYLSLENETFALKLAEIS